MCRFVIYKGREPILLADLLTNPAHSVINQSFDSRLRIDKSRPINGDGFGVGYYADETISLEPAIFTAITPAWNNLNLTRLASKTKSKVVFGHVRASTTGLLAEPNCHPWSYNTLLFMHNGGIASFPLIKRRLQSEIRDRYFLHVQGNTDSENAFALFLNCLHDRGIDPSKSYPDGIPHGALRDALCDTISKINTWCKEVNTTEPSLLNFAVTDGKSVVCTRYISSKTDEAASLFYSSGTSFHQYAKGQYRMERMDKGQDIIMIASEPLTFERADWVTVPTNTILTIHNQTVLLRPLVDEHFVDYGSRSREFAISKGQQVVA